MPRITKLKAQRNPQFVNVFVDGRFVTSLDLTTVVRKKLKVGIEISETKLQILQSESQFGKLYNRALHLLSYRPRSEKELRTHLQRNWKGEEGTKRQRLIDGVINKLTNEGLVNDHQFATWWVEQRQEFRPRGKRFITSELRQKGVDRQIIEEVLSTQDDRESARLSAQKKVRSLRNETPERAQRKLTAFLKRRGFSWEIIRDVVDEMLLLE